MPHDEVVEGLVRGLGVEGEQLAVVALRQVGQTILEALQAFVAHLGGDDLAGAVGLLDGPLDVHQPHGAAGAHEDRRALRTQVTAVARLPVGGGDVRAPAAEVGGVVVVQTAHVGVHQAVQGGLAHHVEGAPPGDVLRHGTHRRRGTRIEHDDVVEAGAVGQLVHQCLVVVGGDAVAHDRVGRGALHELLHRGGHVGHHDGGRSVQARRRRGSRARRRAGRRSTWSRRSWAPGGDAGCRRPSRNPRAPAWSPRRTPSCRGGAAGRHRRRSRASPHPSGGTGSVRRGWCSRRPCSCRPGRCRAARPAAGRRGTGPARLSPTSMTVRLTSCPSRVGSLDRSRL